ncbi:MAG: adenylate/guanylate cyclase domain-containing response regulator [Leptonema sp. (in: Bacteria)]|nr:adenylate/guanylate cyclase domain-containing response regulator [Leptonema sp. (in: bacteria)]
MSAKKAQRILIIEDDETQAEMLRHFLVMWGYEIRISLSGEDAVNSLTEFLPDLILLDLYLPGMPGLDALKHIRAVPELVDIPVFIMSADASEEIKIVALSSGGTEFLPKPVPMADLAMKIQTALELLESRRIIEELNHKLEKEKRRLLRYFSADLVEKILNEEIPAQLGGDIMVSSIMFFDVRGSTTMAEKMGPGFFASFISDLFADIMDIIFDNKGSVNELLGDGILATFGCPVPTDDDAYNAIRAAIDIRTYIQNFNSMVTDKVGYGIGIATGRVFAGNIGSIRRMKYAVMGDPVNAAARIQDMTKELNVPILFDHHTFQPCRNRLRANSHGYYKLRGKEEMVEVLGVTEYDPFIGNESLTTRLAVGESGLFRRFLERDGSFEHKD